MQEVHPKKWIRVPDNWRLSVPYIKATVLGSLPRGAAEYALETERGPMTVEVPIDQSFEAAEEADYSDMCEMSVLNEPEVLNNILRRYRKDEIFTSIGPTLIIVNPYRTIERLFRQEVFEGIKQKILSNKLGKDEPHVYLVAGRAYLALRETGTKQAIVISGQSGAGKTESTKYCMQLLTSLSHRKNHTIQSKILACNPVLEAFGNSKTVRNENSSRFGKFVKIYFNSDYVIKGANIHSYLLEKSRVVAVAKNERNFHSFYALIASNKYNVRSASYYELLKQSGCYESTHIHDAKYYMEINAAFSSIGFTDAEIERIWVLVSCILKLGNVDFEDSNHLVDESKPCAISSQQIVEISQILKVEPAHLERILLFERKKFLKQYTNSPYSKQNCKANLHTFCKAIYNAIFDFILNKIELSLAPTESNEGNLKQINILDIFGFENFQQNSFEQFCINFTNEKLLKLYNNYIFDREMQILREDGLQKQILGILPPTNDEIITMISGKLSLFSIINDMTLPQFRDADIIQGFRRIDHPSLIFDKINKAKFTILHTQAPVDYCISAFKNKNQDKINEEIMDVVGGLFINTMKDQAGKTILSKFSKEIDDLMNELNTSTVHFIRCIKPNQSKTPNSPNQKYILTQIRYLGVFQTIMIRRNTFPFRKIYKDFRKQFILMFPDLKREKNAKLVTKRILQSLTKDSKAYLMGTERVYISSEIQNLLNLQIYKFLALRAEKIKLIQRSLKRCMYRKQIISHLQILFARIQIWKKIPMMLSLKFERNGFTVLREHSDRVKQVQAKKKQQEYLLKVKQQKRQRQLQEQSLKQKQSQRKEAAAKIYNTLNVFVNSYSGNILNQSFSCLRSSNSKTLKLPQLNIQSPMVHNLAQMNSTESVGNSAIDNYSISPYQKPQTPSSQLIGKSQVFDQSFIDSFKTNRHNQVSIPQQKGTLFAGYIQLESFFAIPNSNLSKLKGILAQSYKVQIEGNEEDFFSPPSFHSFFKLEDLPPEALNEVLDFPAESFFNKILRKRTTFLGSKKSYEEILVNKRSVLNKSMTVMPSQADEKRALNIFNTLLKIGEQVKIENVLKFIQTFIELCQSSTIQLKNEIFVQLIRQANSSYELTAIRNYQAMAVFLHVYTPAEELLKSTLNFYYWRLQGKKLGVSENEYLRYIFSIISRKIKKKMTIGYLPISYQIMGLMCKRQISIPVYLPTGNSILIKVQSFDTFADVKARCMTSFGINALRYGQELFTFYEVVNFDNEELDETPIRQTNLVWDMMTYWELTKSKYQENQIKPPNFFLMFKVRYIFQCAIEDEETIELYYSQLYFDFFMGRIILEDNFMLMLSSIIKYVKYPDKPILQIYMGILPIWFSKKIKKEKATQEVEMFVDQMKKNKMSIQEMKYKFAEICQKSELALATVIPTEVCEGEASLYFKNKCIIMVDNVGHMDVISLKKLIKWSIDKEYFYFEIAGESEAENRNVKIKTDYASICNQYLKNIPLPKARGINREKSFLKK